MLKSIRFINWKSFRDATLHIDPLTVLIGANSSGKSNAIEGLQLLSRLAKNTDIETALIGNEKLHGLRGGAEWAGFRGAEQVSFEVNIREEKSQKDFLCRQTVQLKPEIHVKNRGLVLLNEGQMPELRNLVPDSILSKIDERWPQIEEFFAILSSIMAGNKNWISQMSDVEKALLFKKEPFIRTIIEGLPDGNRDLRRELRQELEQFALQTFLLVPILQLFVLEPAPLRMRNYSTKSDTLSFDGSNSAGVIAALPDERRKEVEEALTRYLATLPEYRVRRLYVERFGLQMNDAMLCCEEQWGLPIDARCMSDGTLRFVAILTALLTLPSGSLLVIEDVDTGIHPSRASQLIEVLRTEGKRRGVDILVTTHNEAFLDALPPEKWPFVTVAYRDAETGESKLTPIDELEDYGRILAAAPLGRAVTRGIVERAAHSTTQPKKIADAQERGAE